MFGMSSMVVDGAGGLTVGGLTTGFSVIGLLSTDSGLLLMIRSGRKTKLELVEMATLLVPIPELNTSLNSSKWVDVGNVSMTPHPMLS